MTSGPHDSEGDKSSESVSLSSAPRHVPTSGLLTQEPTPESPLPFGRYQLIRRIGAGGMGEVFLAREGGPSPRAVVVKKVLPNLVANRAFVGRFLDEAKVVVRLDHQNIARVYAMGDVDGEYFLSMEYVQGKTVSRFTKRLRDRNLIMPLGIVLLLGERVCAGLQYAHDAKDESGQPLHLVHRDLSPANVCISYSGEVKIIDFGAAQSTLKEEQTAPRVVIGNLTYMAPEQARKQIIDGRADIYSCGVLLWELLSWHALPQKGDPIERWRKAANPVWEAPSASQPDIPQDVDDVILKAIHKEPIARYATAHDFGEALRKLRRKHAPEVNDSDLAELLERIFSKEKSREDEVIHEAIFGPTVDIPTSYKPRRVVPPTALAFEHTAVLAPVELPSLLDTQDITSPGRALPPEFRSAPPPLKTTAQRTSFGVTYAEPDEPSMADSLIQEIEATDSFIEYESDEADTRIYEQGARLQLALKLLAVFLFATGLGFGLVWLVLL